MKYKTYNNYSGGKNDVLDAKDIAANEWAELQNISVEKRGVARSIGALGSHAEVPTQSAEICPGSGLYVYSSDHWRASSDTVDDLLADDNATSDQLTEVDATTGWTGQDFTTLDSDTPATFGIAASGTTYVMELDGGAGDPYVNQTVTTVVGQKYLASGKFYNPAGGSSEMRFSAGIGGGTFDLLEEKNSTTNSWVTLSGVFIATATTTYIEFNDSSGAAGSKLYADNVYLTAIPPRDITGDWLALSDVAEAQVDLYDDNSDLFSAGSLDFGTVSSYPAGAGTIAFTISTITDSTSRFLNKGFKPGQAWKISNATETGNNRLVYLERVTAGTLYVRGAPLTLDAVDTNAITLTLYNPTSFHFVNEAFRASPVGGGGKLRPKHYSFVDRLHFADAIKYKKEFENWFLNDVGLVAPTDLEVTTANGDGAAAELTAVAGFEIGVIDETDSNGGWAEGAYEVGMSYVYDDGQETDIAHSLAISNLAVHTVAADNSKLTLTVRAKTNSSGYEERISGGRIYTRIQTSDDPWVLLADIDMKQGARASLTTDYSVWADGGTTNVLYTADFVSFRPNPETYEELAGVDPSTVIEDFVTDDHFWDTSVIAGNRCFLASARYQDVGGVPQYFRDRILYSLVGSYDVFPVTNYIDVIRGDADDYVRLIHYNGYLLCFKQRHLYVIDIASGVPGYLKDTFAFRGIEHAGAVFMTPHGPAWSNEHGCYIYDGNTVISLTSDKISTVTWAAFHTDYSIVGFHANTNTLVVMGDCTQDGSGDGYFFDFDQGAWTYGSAVFNSAAMYTNWETDWNQDLIIGAFTTSSPLVTIQTWNPGISSTGQNYFKIVSKDDNMGTEFEKSLQGVIVYHKASAAQTDSFYYALNGSGTFINTSLSTDNTLADTGDGFTEGWTRTVFTPSAPIRYYTLQWRIQNTTAAALMQINDLTLEYNDEEEAIE